MASMDEAIRKADVLIEALPYIQRFAGRPVVIKFGGSAMANSAVLDDAYIEEGCIIGANAVVSQGKRIPANSMAVGVPAKVIRQDEKLLEIIRKNAEEYRKLAARYLQGEFK